MVENLDNERGRSANEIEQESFLLPRQAWQSQIAYLKAILKAKQALDRIEKKAVIEE
jgi:hypothetical protein